MGSALDNHRMVGGSYESYRHADGNGLRNIRRLEYAAETQSKRLA